MKKYQVLSIVLGSIFMAMLFGFGAVRAEAHEDHCVCGGVDDCIATAKQYGHEGVSTQGRTEATWTEVTTGQGLLNAISDAKTAGAANVYLYLSDSIAESIQLPKAIGYAEAGGMHVFLCLNGKTIKTANNNRLFTAYLSGGQSEMKLSLCDCSKPSTGTVQFIGTEISYQGALVTLDGNARFYLYGGLLKDGSAKTYAGNVAVGAGQMFMYGGAVEDGKTSDYGGNISVSSGKLYFYDGTISGGTAKTNGGNIYLSSGKIYMYGGLLANGTARSGGSSGSGGNIRIDTTSGEVYISGGKIVGGVNSTANTDANGHSIFVNGKLCISGDPVFEGVNGKSYMITTQNALARIEISGTPVFYKSSGNTLLIQVTSESSEMMVGGGIFAGSIGAHKGNVYISGGFFDRAVSHAYSDSTGILEITGGYFNAKSTSGALSIPEEVWKVDDSAWIPFEHTVTYPKADDSTASFETNFAVTSCGQVNGRSMELNENLALNLYADVKINEPLYSSARVQVELNGETREFPLATADTNGDGRKKVSFRGVTPELAGDTITVRLYASNGTTLLDTKTYTIKDYLTALRDEATASTLRISAAKKTALDRLVNDLLVYCGEAQKKFDHNTDALVSEGVTGTGADPLGDISVIWNQTAVTAANYQDASVIPGFFKEATVIHENANWIRVQFKDNAGDGQTTFTIEADGEETPAALDAGYLCTNDLKPTEYGNRIVFRAYRGGEVISKVEYSMNSYCVRKHTADIHTFSDALYNYGASAANYAAAE